MLSLRFLYITYVCWLATAVFCDFSWGVVDRHLLIPDRALMTDPRHNSIKVSSVNQHIDYGYSQEYGQTATYRNVDISKAVAL